MSSLDFLLDRNDAFANGRASLGEPRPSRRVAVLTCKDARINVYDVFGFELGEAHILRNAGGRVTDDVLRGLAVASHALGVESLIIMEHTGCGMAALTDEQLREMTGADIDFLTIGDHDREVRHDVDIVLNTPYLSKLTTVGGYVYDVVTGRVREVVRHER